MVRCRGGVDAHRKVGPCGLSGALSKGPRSGCGRIRPHRARLRASTAGGAAIARPVVVEEDDALADPRPNMLDRPVDVGRDHVLGPPDAEMTLVEYGSYACPRCHAVHEVIEGLRSRFGERMRYV